MVALKTSFTQYANIPERIDTSKFSPLTSEGLSDPGLTIKHDKENKLATFLCELSAYTETHSSTSATMPLHPPAKLYPPGNLKSLP